MWPPRRRPSAAMYSRMLIERWISPSASLTVFPSSRRQQARQLVLLAVEERLGAEEDRPPHRGGGGAPGGEGGLRGVHGAPRLLGAGERDVAEDVAGVGGVQVGRGLRRPDADPLAADEVAIVVVSAVCRRRRGHGCTRGP